MTLRKITTGALAALTLATTLAAASPASAGYYYRRGGWNPGAAAAVGVLGGLALGAAVAAPRPAYGYGYAPAPVYAPEPVYVEPARHCWVERHRVWVPGWGYDIRRERVCSY
jgi:hypothetical protein